MAKSNPQLTLRLQSASFAEEAYRLVQRYQVGMPTNQAVRRACDQWCLPDQLRWVLQWYTKCWVQCFASPLTVPPEATEYWSMEERDQLFGARYNPFKVKWTDSSMAVPDLTQPAAFQAFLHALMSAWDTEEPTLTVLALPVFRKTSKRTADLEGIGSRACWSPWIAAHPQNCRGVARVSGRYMNLQAPSHLGGGVAKGMPQAIDIVVVGNRAGFDAYMQGAGADVWAGFQAALEAAMPHVPEPDFNDFISFRGISGTDSLATDPTSLLPSDFQEAKTPSRFAKLAADTSQPSKRPIQTCCIYKLLGNRYVPPPGFDAAAYMEDQLKYAGEEQSSMYLVLLQNFLEAHPMDQAPALRFRYTDWVYCDGSCVEKAEGQRFIAAAVYTPPAEAGFYEGTQDTPQPPRAIAVSCHLEGDPDSMQGYNTINRAELAGILTAIQTNRHKHSMCVATDSLTSIHQIFTALTRPQDMREHRHQHLIQAIISAVQQHPGQVHLQKVKSHCGIMGNELRQWQM